MPIADALNPNPNPGPYPYPHPYSDSVDLATDLFMCFRRALTTADPSIALVVCSQPAVVVVVGVVAVVHCVTLVVRRFNCPTLISRFSTLHSFAIVPPNGHVRSSDVQHAANGAVESFCGISELPDSTASSCHDGLNGSQLLLWQ